MLVEVWINAFGLAAGFVFGSWNDATRGKDQLGDFCGYLPMAFWVCLLLYLLFLLYIRQPDHQFALTITQQPEKAGVRRGARVALSVHVVLRDLNKEAEAEVEDKAEPARGPVPARKTASTAWALDHSLVEPAAPAAEEKGAPVASARSAQSRRGLITGAESPGVDARLMPGTIPEEGAPSPPRAAPRLRNNHELNDSVDAADVPSLHSDGEEEEEVEGKAEPAGDVLRVTTHPVEIVVEEADDNNPGIPTWTGRLGAPSSQLAPAAVLFSVCGCGLAFLRERGGGLLDLRVCAYRWVCAVRCVCARARKRVSVACLFACRTGRVPNAALPVV